MFFEVLNIPHQWKYFLLLCPLRKCLRAVLLYQIKYRLWPYKATALEPPFPSVATSFSGLPNFTPLIVVVEWLFRTYRFSIVGQLMMPCEVSYTNHVRLVFLPASLMQKFEVHSLYFIFKNLLVLSRWIITPQYGMGGRQCTWKVLQALYL